MWIASISAEYILRHFEFYITFENFYLISYFIGQTKLIDTQCSSVIHFVMKCWGYQFGLLSSRFEFHSCSSLSQLFSYNTAVNMIAKRQKGGCLSAPVLGPIIAVCRHFVPPNLPIKVAKKARKCLIISGLIVLLHSEKLIVCLVKFCLSIFAMQDRFPVGIVSYEISGRSNGRGYCARATVLFNTPPPNERSQHHADVRNTAPPIQSVLRAPLGRCSHSHP